MTRLSNWWGAQPRIAKLLVALFVGNAAVNLYVNHHTEACFREYFAVQQYRAGKTDDAIRAARDGVENQGQWTHDLSNPPENLWGNYGPERQHWLTGVGKASTDRSNKLVARINAVLDDKANNPYPVPSCGAP